MPNIPSTPADGNVRTDIVTAIADIKVPKLTELNAASSKNISCYITAGGFTFAPEQATITDDRECDTFTASQPGRVSAGSPTITVIDNTGTALAATANVAVETLVPGSTVYLVRRYGIAHDTAYAVTTQKVDVLHVKVGKKQRIQPEANSVLRSTYALFVQDFAQDVAVVV